MGVGWPQAAEALGLGAGPTADPLQGRLCPSGCPPTPAVHAGAGGSCLSSLLVWAVHIPQMLQPLARDWAG